MHHQLSCPRRFLALAVLIASVRPAAAQDQPPLRVDGIYPAGVRTTATESYGMFEFLVTNNTNNDRMARVVLFYEGQLDVQYARDVWVPAHATIASWLLAGPAMTQTAEMTRGIQVLLYDRSDGQERLLLPPGQERIRSRGIIYRKREPTTAIMRDEPPSELFRYGRLPEPDSAAIEAERLVHVFRDAAKLSEFVQVVSARDLPPSAEAFDGIDHLVLASSRITDDPDGMRALRRWVENGGKVWVMLDLVDPDGLAPLLGDALDFSLVDRVGLTTFALESSLGAEPIGQTHEQPVRLARVLLPGKERARYTVNGWPLWFTRPVGRGKVVFTTLGPRGWYRQRKPAEAQSPFAKYPNLPIGWPPLVEFGEELHSAEEFDPIRLDAFHPALLEEIGFSVVNRRTVALIFAGFLATVAGLGVILIRLRRREWVGWLVPAAALGVAAAFFGLGEWSRRSASPTVAVAQVIDAVPGKEEAAIHGLVALYRPDSGPADLGVAAGGRFDLDMSGLEGQARRLVLTDMNAWHWEDLALPAGVRTAPFHFVAPLQEPLQAVARFGPDGLEGELKVGPFTGLSDALLTMPGGRPLAVHLGPGGALRAGSGDVLPSGQFLASAVLSDQQQRRQELYAQFLKRPPLDRREPRPVLYAWADPLDMRFTLVPDGRTVGSALLRVPVRLEPAKPGTQLTIPGPLVPWRRVIHGGLGGAVRESDQGIEQELRFQLPSSALPLHIDRARLTVKLDAPSRRVILAARAADGFAPVKTVESPLDPIQVDITEERLLHLDPDGGLHVKIGISEPQKGADIAPGVTIKWRLEYTELEIHGRAE